jgi:hypothetical protein
MSALLYIILMCNTGGACTQASDAIFASPQECLHELPKLYYGTLQSNGRFYVRHLSKNSWLECAGAREDDGRIVAVFDSRGRRLPPPSAHAITQSYLDAQMHLQQSLTRLSYLRR